MQISHGEHSNLLYDFIKLHRKISADNDGLSPCMLFENVVPSTLQSQDEVRRAFRLPVLKSEGAVFEAARRPRWLISNMRFQHVPSDTPNVTLQEVLNPGAKALADKAGCIIGGTISGAANESIATAQAHSKRVLWNAPGACVSSTTVGRASIRPRR